MSLLPHQFRTFKAVAEMLRLELVSIQKAIQEQKDAIRDASETNNKQMGKITGVISSDIRSAEDEATYEHTQRDKEYRLQRKIMWVMLGAFVAAAVYAGIAAFQLSTTNKTYEEIQKQTIAAQSAARIAEIGRAHV